MQKFITFEACQEIPAIPFKKMDSQYYTNWLPIEQMNDCKIETMRTISKSKNKKNKNLYKNKKEVVPLRRSQSSLDYSYFKKRYEKKEEYERRQQFRKIETQKHLALNTISQKYLSLRKQDKEKYRGKREQKKVEKNQLVKNNYKMVQPNKRQKCQKNNKDLTRASSSSQLVLKPKKPIKLQDKRPSKNKSKMELNKNAYNLEEIERVKRSQIIFDYYGISSTSASDNQDQEGKEEKRCKS